MVRDVLTGYHGKGKEQWRTLVNDEYINNQDRPAKFRLPKIGLQMLKPAVAKKQRSAAEQRVDTMKKHALITHRALIESNITGEKVDIGIVTGQYGDVSYALFEERDKKRDAQKAVFRQFLVDNVESQLTITDEYPLDVGCVVLDAMHFLLRIPRLPTMKTFADVAEYFFDQFVKPHLTRRSVSAVHVVFDDIDKDPGYKHLLQRDRDKAVSGGRDDALAYNIELATPLPKKSIWTQFCNSRARKRELVKFLCKHVGRIGLDKLGGGDARPARGIGKVKSIITAGGIENGKANKTSGSASGSRGWTVTEEIVDTYQSEQFEADQTIFLHALKSGSAEVLVVSFDTDAFFMGMLAQSQLEGLSLKKIHLQMKPHSPVEIVKFADLNRVVGRGFPILDGASTEEQTTSVRVRTLVSVFVLFGCDYVSRFQSLPHKTVWELLVNNLRFVLGMDGQEIVEGGTWIGSLTDWQGEPAFFGSFCRLVAVAYHKNAQSYFRDRGGATIVGVFDHAANLTREPEQTEEATRQLEQMNLACDDEHEIRDAAIPVSPHLRRFLSLVREATIERSAVKPEEVMPTIGALYAHFLRAKGVFERFEGWKDPNFQHADINTRGLRDVKDSSTGSRIRIEFRHDTFETRFKLEGMVQTYVKGCNCKGGCRSAKCGCVKKGRKCGPRCHTNISREEMGTICANIPVREGDGDGDGGDGGAGDGDGDAGAILCGECNMPLSHADDGCDVCSAPRRLPTEEGEEDEEDEDEEEGGEQEADELSDEEEDLTVIAPGNRWD